MFAVNFMFLKKTNTNRFSMDLEYLCPPYFKGQKYHEKSWMVASSNICPNVMLYPKVG